MVPTIICRNYSNNVFLFLALNPVLNSTKKTILFHQFFQQKSCWLHSFTNVKKLFDYIKCYSIHLFPALHAFWFLENPALHENRISGTVLMIQLTWNSPTCAKIRVSGERASGNRVMRGLGVNMYLLGCTPLLISFYSRHWTLCCRIDSGSPHQSSSCCSTWTLGGLYILKKYTKYTKNHHFTYKSKFQNW